MNAPRENARTNDDGPTFAAIDLGSNSFRLETSRLARGRVVRVDYLKETVRLGGGIDIASRLGAAAMQRGWDCLARFGERLRGFAPERVRAVATQTLREALNRDEFLVPAQRLLGFPIEVIAGHEEARLIYGGVAHLLPQSDERRLVVDIGGRSTELALGQGTVPSKVESYPVGSVGLSLRHFVDGRLTRSSIEAATLAAQAVLEDALGVLAKDARDAAYGSAGTVGAIANIVAARGGAPGTARRAAAPAVTRDALEALVDELVQAGHVDQLELPGLKDDRRAVIGGGVAALRAVFALAGIEAMQYARGALRHGVLYEMLERHAATGAVREHAAKPAFGRAGQRRSPHR